LALAVGERGAHAVRVVQRLLGQAADVRVIAGIAEREAEGPADAGRGDEGGDGGRPAERGRTPGASTWRLGQRRDRSDRVIAVLPGL
jgi:hypothetical protein